MATSGNKYVGKSLSVSVGGTVLDATVVRSFTLDQSHDIHDSTGAGGGSKTFIGGEVGRSFSMELWNTDDDGDVVDNIDITSDGGVAFIVYPNGNTSGEIKISFTGIFSDTSEGIEKNSVTPYSVSGTITGDVTRATVT